MKPFLVLGHGTLAGAAFLLMISAADPFLVSVNAALCFINAAFFVRALGL